MEWKSIEKDGLPDRDGRVIVNVYEDDEYGDFEVVEY